MCCFCGISLYKSLLHILLHTLLLGCWLMADAAGDGQTGGGLADSTEDPLYWIEMMNYWDNDYYDNRVSGTTWNGETRTAAPTTSVPVDYADNERKLRIALITGIAGGMAGVLACVLIIVLLWRLCCVELFKEEAIVRRLFSNLTRRNKPPREKQGIELTTIDSFPNPNFQEKGDSRNDNEAAGKSDDVTPVESTSHVDVERDAGFRAGEQKEKSEESSV